MLFQGKKLYQTEKRLLISVKYQLILLKMSITICNKNCFDFKLLQKPRMHWSVECTVRKQMDIVPNTYVNDSTHEQIFNQGKK